RAAIANRCPDGVAAGGALESDGAALLEPPDHLRGGAEPAANRAQRAHEVDVKVAPETLGPVAPVVPENREGAAQTSGVRQQHVAAAACVGFGEVEPLRKEQRAVLNVERQGEQRAGTQRSKDLRRAVSVANR